REHLNMKRAPDKTLLRKILTRYDQLGHLRKQIFEGKETTTTIERLKRQSKKKIDEINKEFKTHEFSGPLATLLKRYRLNKYQLVIILALLRQRLVFPTPSLTGRELLQMIFDDSYGILRGMTFIDSSSLLVSTGIIIPDDEELQEDLLESKFLLSNRVFSMIYNTFAPPRSEEIESRNMREGSYRNNMAFLMDLRSLSLLYQKRTTKVFNYDYWDEIGLGVSESVAGINRQLDLKREQIKNRLEKTETKDRLYTLQFIEHYQLNEEETVILITLLFQEITEGNAYLNAVDLLRLTAQNEEDLVKKRRFFSPKRNLVKNKIIQLEEMVNDKELTAEVCMPNWAVERMLTGIHKEGAPRIDADARLDFHRYLNNLDSSEDFLEDLEG
ncbi:MAG: hypothetical protein KJ645_07640, partial [Planctomycetes bacterium]|nr:hypothetical protein [Planctomycetota bacterium]